MGEDEGGTVALPATGHSPEGAVLKEQVVDVLVRLGRGEPVLAVARVLRYSNSHASTFDRTASTTSQGIESRALWSAC